MEETALRSMTMHRRLCQVVLSPTLDEFYQRGTAAIGDLEQWYGKYSDHGATHYFKGNYRGTPHLIR